MLPLTAIFLAGCSQLGPEPRPRTEEESRLFGPSDMKLDSFSKIKSLNGNGVPDGIEALVEFDDRFGDRTKAAGTLYFELYEYRPGWPDPRGTRLANPWTGSLISFDDQKAHWERASGAYAFRLAYEGIQPGHNYVLTATFESAGGGRFFSQIVLQQLERIAEPADNKFESTTRNSGAATRP